MGVDSRCRFQVQWSRFQYLCGRCFACGVSAIKVVFDAIVEKTCSAPDVALVAFITCDLINDGVSF